MASDSVPVAPLGIKRAAICGKGDCSPCIEVVEMLEANMLSGSLYPCLVSYGAILGDAAVALLILST